MIAGNPTRPDSFRAGRKAAPGFTLLELAIVIFIMGLVITLLMPYLGGLRGAQLKSQARQLAAHAHYLYDEAGAQKVVLRLNFDLDNNSYYVTRLDPFAAKPVFLPDRGLAGARVRMPPGIRIVDVTVQGIGTARRGTVSSQFYPGGYADATVIHLGDEAGDVFTMSIDPFSGHVEVVRGYSGGSFAAASSR
jgi:general secretion pathway protein H